MTRFMAIKIHYDHRENLPRYLKYSKPPLKADFENYYKLHEEGIGGEGFHECLNYSIPETGTVKIYLPSTCLPGKQYYDDDFLIFSVTYKGDKELPSAIVGVHGSAKIVAPNDKLREDHIFEGDFDDLFYQAESPPNLVTLFTTPIPYKYNDGIFTPAFKVWGFGLRYLEKEHAENILKEAYKNARTSIKKCSSTEAVVVEREICVLKQIYEHYWAGKLESPSESDKKVSAFSPNTKADREIGYKGELAVYEEELEKVKNLDLTADKVEWVSRGVPTSVYDIKTVRKSEAGVVDHFIEVKSSKMDFGENVYFSARQLTFFEENPECSSVAFVNFDRDGENPEIVYKSILCLKEEFVFASVKYKLESKK